MDLLALAAAFLGGLLTGTLTGLLPGLHVNVAAALMAASAPLWTAAGVPPLAAATWIVTAAVTHAFFEAVPSLFLGVPSDEAYALLPAHRLVRRGRGLEALRHTLFGGLWGLVLGLGAAAVLLGMEAAGVPAASSLDALLRPMMGWILAGVSVLLLALDRRFGWALAVFLASGLLGLVVFASPLFPGEGAAFGGLFPALTGLFGASGLVLALREPAASLPHQEEAADGPPSPFGSAVAGALGGMVVGLLPGLGAGNAAALFSLRKRGEESESFGRRYLVMVSSINLSDALYGLAALVLLQRSRSGASAALETFFPEPTQAQVLFLGCAMLGAGLLCHRVLKTGGLRLARGLNGLHPGGLNGGTLAFLVVLVAWTTGFWGLVLLAAATALGLVAPLSGARRAQAMGFFLVPTILFFSGRSAEVATALRLEGASLPAPGISAGWLAAGLALSLVAGICIYNLMKRTMGPLALRAPEAAAPEEADLPVSGGRALRVAAWVAGAVVLALLAAWAWGQFTAIRPGSTFEAEVVSVADGDTFSVRLPWGSERQVRLEGVDCPESDQPFGEEAARFTADRVSGRTVSVRSHGVDRYGRILGRVTVDGSDLNLDLVRAGWAWHYKQYSQEAALAEAERQARADGAGLWGGGGPVAPWEWRHPEAQEGSGVQASPPAGPRPAEATPTPPPGDLEVGPPAARPTAAATPALPYHGNTSSRKFHRPGCRNYDCKNCTAEFSTREEALAAGYKPAGCCKP